MIVPAFLLKRIYIKGSLRHDEGGFQLQLKNSLGSGYAREMLPLVVDGEKIPKEDCSFMVDGRETAFTEINPDTPFTLALNKETTLLVRGCQLSQGSHRIRISFVAQGIGEVSFEITDVPDSETKAG